MHNSKLASSFPSPVQQPRPGRLPRCRRLSRPGPAPAAQPPAGFYARSQGRHSSRALPTRGRDEAPIRVSTSSPRLTSAYAGREVGWQPSWRAREATGPGRCCRKRFPGRSPGRYRSWTPVSCHRGTRRRRHGYPCSTPASEAYCYSHEVLRNELSNELRTCTPSTTVCLTSPPCGHDSTTRLHDSVTQVPLTAV